MVALGARFRLRGISGERWVAASDFFLGLFATALAPEEILIEVEIPALPAGSGWAFHEVARRHGDYAQVGAAVIVSCAADGRCQRACLVFLAVGDTPVLARDAAALLVGEPLSDQAIAAAAAHAARHEIEPAGDIHASADFKRHLARVVATRALAEARQRATGGARARSGGPP
jgi:aerobic carbon-monoxide dehydrogenase medium subunit